VIRTPLIPAGEAAGDWLTFDYDPALRQLPQGEGTMAEWVETQISAAGINPEIGTVVDVWHWAWHYVELLRIADALPGGLNRTNFLLAAWSADLRPPLNWPGIRFTLNGPADANPIETARLIEYSTSDEAWHEVLVVANE